MKRSRSKHAQSPRSSKEKARRQIAAKRESGNGKGRTDLRRANENLPASDWRSTAASVRRDRRADAQRRAWRWVGAGAVACCLLAILFVVSDMLLAHAHAPITAGAHTKHRQTASSHGDSHPSGLSSVLAVSHKKHEPVRVMFIGGSIAEGEHAPNNYGYLQRAFASLSRRSKTQIVMYDKAIRGANGTQLATMYKGEYEDWLNTLAPRIVVISWGLLNDALPDTPLPTFDQYIKQEIDEALAKHAKVMVVTPPVTKATYEKFPTQEKRYAEAEVRLVRRMRNPNVVAFDVFDQMKSYIKRHHQTVVPYASDPNHPNKAGHALAGRLLYRDMVRKYYRATAQ